MKLTAMQPLHKNQNWWSPLSQSIDVCWIKYVFNVGLAIIIYEYICAWCIGICMYMMYIKWNHLADWLWKVIWQLHGLKMMLDLLDENITYIVGDHLLHVPYNFWWFLYSNMPNMLILVPILLFGMKSCQREVSNNGDQMTATWLSGMCVSVSSCSEVMTQAVKLLQHSRKGYITCIIICAFSLILCNMKYWIFKIIILIINSVICVYLLDRSYKKKVLLLCLRVLVQRLLA